MTGNTATSDARMSYIRVCKEKMRPDLLPHLNSNYSNSGYLKTQEHHSRMA
ncbi:MAG: hypothetical protein VZR11_00265 [Succinimonas sp.]|nr:hypothetical protein [Succinimonas sp.]